MTPATILNLTAEELNAAFSTPKKITPPFPWVQHIPFAFVLMRALKPKQFVELGVHTGNSYFAFCQSAFEAKTGTKCYGIDTWKGDPHASFYDPNIFSKVSEYNSSSYEGFSSLLRMTFDEGLTYFSAGSIDLLHIDGYHTYEAVKHDFTSWLPKMSPSGVIIFHDTMVKQFQFGVWKFFEEISALYPSFTFHHGHGLGVVCVGKEIPNSIAPIFNNPDQQELARTFFSHCGHHLLLQAVNQSVGKDNIQLEERFHNHLPEASMAQLSLDLGSGYSEENTWRTESTIGTKQINFSLPKSINAKKARIYCFNGPHAVKIKSVTAGFLGSNEETPVNYEVNSNHNFEGVDIFADYSSGIVISVPESKSLSSVTVEFELVSIGARVYELIASHYLDSLKDVSAQLQIRTDERNKAMDSVAKFENTQKDVIRLQAHIKHLESQLQSAREANDRYQADLESMLHSKSWKITAPLRGIIHTLKS